jgi:hypothetical protein
VIRVEVVTTMVSTLAGSMPAFPDVILGDVAGRGSQLRAGAGVEQHELALGPDAVTVKGIGTCASVRPPAWSAAWSHRRRVLDELLIVRLSQMPSYLMTSMSPTLNLATSWTAFAQRRREELQRSVEAERGTAAAVEITKPRREILCMSPPP